MRHISSNRHSLTFCSAELPPDVQLWCAVGFLLHVALPTTVIGLGNGAALGPLTVAGVAGVDAQDRGAASGVVNAFHQLGGSLGLAVLVVVFAASGSASLSDVQLLVKQIETALLGASALLGLSLITALALVVPSERLRLAD